MYPDQWKCDSLVTTDTLAQILGGPVHATDAAAIPPNGVPHPCTYLVETSPPEAWTFDIDCRDNMKQRADALFAQYAKDSADQVAQFSQLADAGALKNLVVDAARRRTRPKARPRSRSARRASITTARA